MRTVHFVYSVPEPANNLYNQLYKRISKRIKSLPPIHRYGINKMIKWPVPVHAPYSITYHLLNNLSKKFITKLYDIKESIECKLTVEDILLAHFWPEFSDNGWVRPCYDTTSYKAIKKRTSPNLFAIGPYNHDYKQVGWYKEIFETNHELKFIAICGKHWIDTWHDSPLSESLSKNNVLQVNMAIDSSTYPFIKKTFSPKQKRKFLYIGRSSYPKNIKALENIAKTYKGFQGGYISTGEIQGWTKIADGAELTADFIKEIAKEYDFFLSTSEADAQATTVLEQMCFGFGVASTPESGYNYPSIVKLDTIDVSFNCHQIELIQNLEIEEIHAMTKMNRIIAEKQHSWEEFCKQVINYINP